MRVKKPNNFILGFKWAMIMIFWSFPLGVVGVALMATIIGIPLGIPVLALASAPLASVTTKHIKQGMKWEDHVYHNGTDEPMPSDDDYPWVTS